jgi:plastocyanin
MYVLQFAAEFNAQRLRYVPAGGEVRRVNPDGTTSSVVSGLMFPTSLTVGPDGALYVSNYGNESNDGRGQILRIVVGSMPVQAPAVALPDESRSYVLPQPTPAPQAAASTGIAGTVGIAEPADPTQWGYDPKTFTVQTGQAITFTNRGKISHTVTQSQGAFDTGFIAGGESRTLTFDSPGTFAYFCQPHPWMQGTIVVEGEPRGPSAQAAASASIPEASERPPTIGIGRAIVFVGILLVPVFALGIVGRRRTAARR